MGQPVRGVAVRSLVVILLGTLMFPPGPARAGDGIELGVQRGPGALEVTLEWSGGAGPYRVYRSAQPAGLAQPPNLLGTTAAASWTDVPLPADVYYYQVAAAPTGAAPAITSIAPSGASFGDLITIGGSGFGEDPTGVSVRFSYTEGSETHVVEQRPFWTTDTTMLLAVPFTIPDRINDVQVLVGTVASTAVAYYVAPLHDDPTPLESGNETTAFLDRIELLVQRLDAKLDPWFVGTGTNSQAEVDGVHASMAQIQGALAQLRAHVAGQSPDTLRITDTFLGTAGFAQLLDGLQQAADALQGSPPGTVLCEGAAAQDQILGILHTIDVIAQIIETTIQVLNTACAGSTFLSIITLGATSPVAAAICGVANMLNSVVAPIIDAIQYISLAASGITRAAPRDFIPGTYVVEFSHLLWGPDPPVVYVQGGYPVEARAFSDFHNADCNPSGCPIDFDLDIYGIPVPIDLAVPYKVVQHQALRCTQGNPQGGPAAYTDFDSIDDGATCRFNGADVGGPAWERGTYAIHTWSACGAATLPVTVPGNTFSPHVRSFPVVSGPRLYSVQPAAAQLGGQIELQGAYMPPLAADATAKAELRFGADSAAFKITAVDDYLADVPDITNASGTVGLRVQGRDADQTLPFAVLPPVLTAIAPAAPFAGETVHVLGSGFAANPSSNALTLDGSPQPILAQTGNHDVLFRVPAGSAGGDLQLTAMGVHASNTLALPVATWSAPVRLSHPDRQAFHPALAVAADGTVGAAWIDRHGDGGGVRLLFTDAEPGDAAFRAPIEISTNVLGPPSAPSRPDLAVGPDGRFHLVWVGMGGAIRLASFAKGADPAGDSVVDFPDGVYRDPTIAVEPGGNIHIAAIDVPLDATPHNSLVHWRSTDGGASFPEVQELHGPNVDSPWERGIFHVGDPDLSADASGVKLAYTKGCHGECDTSPSTLIEGRGVLVRPSADGWNWSAPVMVHPGSTFNDGDLRHPSSPTVTNLILHRQPAVAGDAGGAIVAWERPTFGTHPAGGDYATLAVCANHEPIDTAARLTLTPTAQDYQNDEGQPALAHLPGAIPQTSIAWVERVAGTSPDRVDGVPRVRFNRSTDRLASLGLASSLNPSVGPGDTSSVDAEPALGVDAVGGPHLVWLQGPEGHRVVYYAGTGAPYADAPADDPAPEPDDARSILAIDLEDTSTESVNVNRFHGTILYDPGHPNEVRWVGTSSELTKPDARHDRPSFSPEGKLFYRGAQDFAGPTLVDLDGRAHLFASDDAGAGSTLSELTRPIHLPDGRVVAGRLLSGGQVEVVVGDATAGYFTAVTAPFANGELELDVTSDGRYLVYEDTTAHPDEIVILDLSTSTELDRRPGRNPVWYPIDDTGTYWVGYVLERVVGPGPDVEHVLVELSTAGEYEELFVTQPDGFIGRLAYAPDGDELAFDCRLCGDAAADGEGTSSIRLNNADAYVPREPGTNAFSPEYAPASDAIAFMSNDAPPLPDTSMQLMIWWVGDPAAEEHLGPAVGDTPPGFPNVAPRLVWRAPPG